MSRIAVGDKLPAGELTYMDEDNSLKTLSITEFAAGKKIVLFGVPGAFTPTCSIKHVPGFLEQGPALKAKGVDAILCITVNDPFVVNAWSKTYSTNTDIIKFLADGSGVYTKALGLELDLTSKGLGIRSERFAMLVDNLEVKVAHIENGGAFEVSSAEEILKALK